MARGSAKKGLDWSKAKPLPRGTYAKKGVRMPLRAVREVMKLTQADVASAAGIDQGEVSRIERRDDVMVSTLARYAKALGARLELALVFETGHRMLVDVPGDAMSYEQADRWTKAKGAVFTMYTGGPTGHLVRLEIGSTAVDLPVTRSLPLEQVLPRLVALMKERLGEM